MEPIQRHVNKMLGKAKKTQTKLQRQIKTIRGTVVTKMKKTSISHESPFQLKRPHELK
jgi:hypothetical protein